MITIKTEPELRHVLTHIVYAIRALRNGCPRAAEAELLSIEEFILWEDDSDHALEKYYASRGMFAPRRPRMAKGAKGAKGAKTCKGKSGSKTCKGKTKPKGGKKPFGR